MPPEACPACANAAQPKEKVVTLSTGTRMVYAQMPSGAWVLSRIEDPREVAEDAA